MLKILTQKQAAFLSGGNRQDQGIPDRHLVIRCKIEGAAHRFEGGIRHLKCIRPTENRSSRIGRRTAGFSDKNSMQFTEGLRRQHDQLPRKSFYKRAGQFASRGIADTLGVGENIGVEGDARHAG